MDTSLHRFTLELVITQKDLDVNADILTLLANSSPKSCPLSKSQIKQAMQKGALWIQKADSNYSSLSEQGKVKPQHKPKNRAKVRRLRRLSSTFSVGDQLFLHYDLNVLKQEPSPALLIHDADSYSVWYKPYGMYAQGSKWADHCTIQRWAEQHLQPQRPAYVVHRLDRATSGLILLAHKKSSATALASMFESHDLIKVYQAVVHGDISHMTQTLCINTPIDDRSAVSHISFIKLSACSQYSLVSVSIDTGRKHQIRRHLSEIGFPIVGDRLYGSCEDDLKKDLQLVAGHLSFTCPITASIQSFTLPLELQLTLN